MTLPYERTRSVVQARDFLTELSQDESLPEEVRTEAKRLLRHYPSKDEVLRVGRLEEHLTSGTVFQAVFGSTIER